MSAPESYRYTESHEWLALDGDTVRIGITQFAVNELTDITYVEMREEGTTVGAGDSIGEVESVKATSDIFSAVPGEIIEINAKLSDDPSLVNTDPYGEGWLVKIRASDTSALDALMDAGSYDEKYAVA